MVLSYSLTRLVLAFLRYDIRGTGDSTGDFASATTSDFISDAEAAVAYLTTRADFDHQHIGLIGHSEGGLVPPAVAAAYDA